MMASSLESCGGTDGTELKLALPPVVAPEGSPWATSKDAEWVFAEEPIRTYEFTLSDTDWAYLNAHALDEEYQPATLSVDGTHVGVVGLRYKGSNGTLRRCARDGRLLCDKLSMKLRFDEYEPSKRFFGLKRLNFNSMLSDASYLHERLAYRMFREMGVAAPRAVHAQLVVNGEDLGVFSLVEAIDGRFTDSRFTAGDGNLYKERWTNTDNPGWLTSGLKTNEVAPRHDAMIQFHDELNAASADELPEVVARYMDVDQLYTYLAVDRAISNWDGVTAFYCRGGCNNHNFYFYQHEEQPRFTLIPWDLDNTFTVTNSFDYVPGALVIPPSCPQRFPVFADMTVLGPACDPLLQGLALGDVSRYRAIQEQLLEGPFELGALEEWIDERVAQLTPAVEQEARGRGMTAFRSRLDVLRRNLRLLAERVRVEMNGEEIVRSRVIVGAKTDFESAKPIGIRFGLSARYALGSSFDVTLGESGALGGARHLSLAFELRNGDEPPWVRYVLPFDAPVSVDLSNMSKLRFVLESDAPRAIRIGFDSAAYSVYLPRSVLGWDIMADGSRQEFELAFSAAAFPAGAPPVPESPSDVLRQARELLIDPAPIGTDRDGYLGEGTTDSGRICIDDIEFLP